MKILTRFLICISLTLIIIFGLLDGITDAGTNYESNNSLPIININKIVNEKEYSPEAEKETNNTGSKTPQTTQKNNSRQLSIQEKNIIPEQLLPASVNLDIPFYAQAPDGRRVLPWKEACEEAAIVLGAYYLMDKPLSKEQFKQDVLAITKLQQQLFNTYIDTTMAQLKTTYDTYFAGVGTSKIIDNPSIQDIKIELAQGNVVLAPFAGRELENPHFLNGGPRYHMAVIRGYDDTYFYTNEVGTSRGENYRYKQEVIMEAIHDLVDGDISTGPKRIVVLVKD